MEVTAEELYREMQISDVPFEDMPLPEQFIYHILAETVGEVEEEEEQSNVKTKRQSANLAGCGDREAKAKQRIIEEIFGKK